MVLLPAYSLLKQEQLQLAQLHGFREKRPTAIQKVSFDTFVAHFCGER